jgi:CRISPR/Cas system-associated exonuclease Cas4 (RecB family)
VDSIRFSWQPDDMSKQYVSASEVASYAYCPESWRLEKGRGLEPARSNTKARAQGVQAHREWQRVGQITEKVERIAFLLFTVAALAWLCLWWFSR